MFVSLKDLKDRILNPNPHLKKSLIEQLNRHDAFRLKLKKTAVMFYKQNNTPLYDQRSGKAMLPPSAIKIKQNLLQLDEEVYV
jgi:hypothetical protein